jgi:hypothetical protein
MKKTYFIIINVFTLCTVDIISNNFRAVFKDTSFWSVSKLNIVFLTTNNELC